MFTKVNERCPVLPGINAQNKMLKYTDDGRSDEPQSVFDFNQPHLNCHALPREKSLLEKHRAYFQLAAEYQNNPVHKHKCSFCNESADENFSFLWRDAFGCPKHALDALKLALERGEAHT